MSTDVATIDYRGTAIPVRGEFVAVKQMADAMGIDWEGQRQLIMRSPWSTGFTCEIQVNKTGRPSFALHRRRVPMWVANISSGHLQDETVKATVIRWQTEIADVLADYYEGKPKAATKPRRKRIAGSGTPFPDELEFLKQSGARRVKLPSGFEIEFATEGMEYAASLLRGMIREELGDHEALLAATQAERKEFQKERAAFSIQQAGGIPPAPDIRRGLSTDALAKKFQAQDEGRS